MQICNKTWDYTITRKLNKRKLVFFLQGTVLIFCAKQTTSKGKLIFLPTQDRRQNHSASIIVIAFIPIWQNLI